MSPNLTNNFSGSAALTFDYTYDDVGNRLTMTADDTDQHDYDYDNIYQLTQVEYPDTSTTNYYYDSLGNRTSVVNGGTVNYMRNRLNQYYSVGGSKYRYDENGNLTDINNSEYEYIYDCENQLIEAKKNSQAVAAYGYDFAGRRISKTVSQTTTKYCYDGGQVIAEYNGSTLLRKFVYGPGIDEPICMIVVAGESETVYYYHFDGLGSVAALSDVNSVVVERYSYDVFGEPNRVSGVNNPYLFTGRRYDSETSLYYYRARYYKPEIGRFLQTDPIGYAGGLNMYAYVQNNPVIFNDPFGLLYPGMGDFLPGIKPGGSDLPRIKPWPYFEDIPAWPWDILYKAWDIDKEEYPDYEDPFVGDYRHFVGAGMLCRRCTPLIGAICICWRQHYEEDPDDSAAEWRGWRQAMLHPFTPLRELGKKYTVRPIGKKRTVCPK